MPAGSDPSSRRSASRTVFRPVRARRVIYFCVGLVALAFLGGNLLLPSSGRGSWGLGSRIALGALGALVVCFLHRLASVRVVADETGATVVNIARRRRLDWAQIVGVRLSADDPWLMLDLSDGEPLAAMGVQKSEGARAQRQAQEFARLVNEGTRAPDR